MAGEGCQVIFNTRVRLKESLQLTERDTVSFFAEIMKVIPELNDYRRVQDDFHLVQKSGGELVRQVLLQKNSITLAIAPPLTLEEAHKTANIVYPLISRHINPPLLLLDFMDVSFRFEITHKGNHDMLVLSSLFGSTPYAEIARATEGAVRNFQPALSLSLAKDHSLIALVEIQTGTSAREIESGVYDGDEIRVLCGVAKVRGLASQPLETTYQSLQADALRFFQERVVRSVIQPLQAAATQAQPA